MPVIPATGKATPAGEDAPPLRLARLLAREGRREEAEAVLRRAQPTAGERTVLGKELARLLQAQRRYHEAEAQWQALVRTAPEDEGAVQGVVRVLRLRHRFADAAQAVRDAVVRAPASRALLLEAARLAAQREAHAEAARLYQQALAVSGPAAEVLDELAMVRVAEQRFAAAEAILAHLVTAEPRKPAWRASLARAAEERGDLELAIRRWDAVLELDHGHLRAQIAIGRLLEEFGRLSEAEALYRDLAETRPTALEPYYQLGRMALVQSDLQAAVGWLEKALALDADDWSATAALARTMAEQHRFGAARRMAKALAARLPDHLEAYLLVAWVEDRAGRARAAERALAETGRLFPQAFLPPLKLADILGRHGEHQRAREVLEAAHPLNPDTLTLNLARVDACFATRDLPEAARRAEALHASHPEQDPQPQGPSRQNIGRKR
jgi:tetratricopeptide (TPR) repeat protein